LASHQAKKFWQARCYAARVLSLPIEPKKLAKRFAARGSTSATSADTTIGRPNGVADPGGRIDGRQAVGGGRREGFALSVL
jgi:hypothetical protein